MSENLPITLFDKPAINGTAYLRNENNLGLAQSIASVPEGQVRLAPQGITIARSLAPANQDALWRWFDLNGELIRPLAEKSYNGFSKGAHNLVLVNATNFSHNPQEIESAVKEGKLLDYSFPLSPKHVDMVLGDKVVMIYDAQGKHQEASIDGKIWTPNQFNEEQKRTDFRKTNQFYVLKLTDEEVKDMNHGYIDITDKRVKQHTLSAALAGGYDIFGDMVDKAIERGNTQFYVGMPLLAGNGGRVAFVGNYILGFDFYSANVGGCSVGVAPEALDALVKNYKELKEPASKLQRDILNLIEGTAPKNYQDALNKIVNQYDIKNK